MTRRPVVRLHAAFPRRLRDGLALTSPRMKPSPVMSAFAERFGFRFEAHELGDKSRDALAERNFDYLENNFCPSSYQIQPRAPRTGAE